MLILLLTVLTWRSSPSNNPSIVAANNDIFCFCKWVTTNNNRYHAEIILTQRVLMPDAREKPKHSLQLCVRACSCPITDP